MSFNHLVGTIPATWGASATTGFYALRYLDLRGNMLMGTLPPGLGKTLNLLPGNAFCGAIPANATICQRRAFCDPAQISYFCSCGDSLSALPDCAGGWHALVDLGFGQGCRLLPSASGHCNAVPLCLTANSVTLIGERRLVKENVYLLFTG